VNKPAGWAAEHARTFHEESVAAAYQLRPPYPDELFTTLLGLAADRPRTVLDLGTGPGDLARNLVGEVERVDAVDASLAMIERGRSLPGGDHPRLRWIHGPAEDAPLDPPYALVTAADSLHWMDWAVVLPRIAASLSPNGLLAIAGRGWGTGTPEERELLVRHSTNKAFRPLNLVDELVSRGLFEVRGRRGFTTAWRPTIDEYIGARHSQAAVSVEPAPARAFDDETRALLERLVDEGRIETMGERLALTVQSGAAWGVPAGTARPGA
jgi:SAM-dependent methyltransferase